MGRPAHTDPEATRRRILTTAAALYSTRGLGSTSMRHVARGAGVSVATVHHHFHGKEGLYDACVDAMDAELGALREDLGKLALVGGDAQEVVDRIVRACFRFARKHRSAIRLLLRAAIDAGRLSPERRQRVHLPFLREGAPVLAALSGQPESEARLAMQSVQHLVVRYAITDDEELKVIVGCRGKTGAAAAVEGHLVGLTLRLLGIQGPLHSPRGKSGRSRDAR